MHACEQLTEPFAAAANCFHGSDTQRIACPAWVGHAIHDYFFRRISAGRYREISKPAAT
jgi:hypothetical protein